MLSGSDVYDGVYNMEASEINEMNWWTSRDDVDQGNSVKLYYYNGMEGRRWRLEGSTYSFWAPDDLVSRETLYNRQPLLEKLRKSVYRFL